MIKGGEGNLDRYNERADTTVAYVRPHKEVRVWVDYEVPRFRSAKLRVPLRDVKKNVQTTIIFELEYLLSYDQMWY